ncbi:hypothetical protein LJB92_01840 [Bacteroidales bacterium OttesenSCG-928-M06]|nr:hypothetical protein [Bacteroidales bacterium OttesenSCG-928-M06]
MKLVDVAIFTFPNDASVLESILSGENIEYALNNQDSAIIAPGTGTLLSVKEGDVEKVIKIIRNAGFERNLLSLED